MKMIRLTTIFFFVFSGFCFSQGVGIGTKTPNPSAALDVTSNIGGLLYPRMTTAQRDAIASPAAGLCIYNISTNCIEYFNGDGWFNMCLGKIAMDPTSGGTSIVSSLNCNKASTGTIVVSVAVLETTQTIELNVDKIGTWSISTDTQNGITFSGSGTFVSTGVQTITLTATGTPTTAGLTTFRLNSTPNCTFDRTIVVHPTSGGTSIIGELWGCNASVTFSSGVLHVGVAASGVSQTLRVTASKTGTWNISTDTQNGITFSGSGTFSGTGNQYPLLTASGTPIASGSFYYTLNTTPSCGFYCTILGSDELLGTATTPANTRKVWKDKNLGATRVATSSTDQLAYGDLYQWGRGTDGHEKITWTGPTAGSPVNGTTTAPSANPGNLFVIGGSDWRSPQMDTLWQGGADDNNPCPAGFRIPTISEFEYERGAQNITSSATAFSSTLKLPVPGRRDNVDGTLFLTGEYGYYWTSSIISAGGNANAMRITDITAGVFNANRSVGYSVRCVKDYYK